VVGHMILGKDTRNNPIRGISFQHCFQCGVKVLQDGGRGKGLFEEVKGSLLGCIPVELNLGGAELGERLNYSGVAFNESPVEISKSQERLELPHSPGSLPLSDSLDFLRIHLEGIWGNDKTKEASLGSVELTFFTFDIEASSSQLVKDLVDMANMFFWGGGVDEDIIKVDNNKDIKELSKDIIDKGLTGSRSICQSKRHHQKLIEPIPCPKSSEPLITTLDPNKVVSTSQIKLGIHLACRDGSQTLIDEGERVCIFLGDGIQSPVVHTESEPTISFLDKQDWRSCWRCGGLDESFVQVFL